MRARSSVILLLVAILSGLMALSFRQGHAPSPYAFRELKYFPPMPQSPDNPLSKQGVELGRFLFYDPILSRDSSMSCSSCHRQEKAFSDSPRQFSSGLHEEKLTRNTMPLFNLAWYESFFWDGKAASIEEQVLHPVKAHNEMDLSWEKAVRRINRSAFYPQKFKVAFGSVVIDSILIAKAIAQFERSLISYNSKYDKVLRGESYFTKDEYQGFVLINDQTKGDCLHCHTTDADALGTTGGFSNNGLEAVFHPDSFPDKGKAGISGRHEDLGKFKIPSLRNIALTPPYMHDGRFETLQEVINFYSEGVQYSPYVDPKMGFAHHGGARLSDLEKKQILAFLHTLTDSSFITDPAYANPFSEEISQ